jgi:D-methionine transport system ATP-binding protein
LPAAAPVAAQAAPAMIEFDQLTKVFEGRGEPVPVLRGVSLRISRGEIFGVIGRSGAGKSTLVRCVNLLERPTSGRVVVDGKDVTALGGAALREARRHVGMIFQHFNLLSSRTVLENVAFPLELAGRSREEIRREVEPLLELVGLADKRDRYPAELSGGQKQRVGIARALAPRPSVLLCDEATSALDPETTQSILALLRDINRRLGLTILLITHEMAAIQAICDRVAVLDHGRIVDQGTVFDVFTAPKAEVTRSFVRDVVDRELPSWLVEAMRATAPGAGRPVLRIVFTGPSAHAPVVSEVVKRFDVALNILQANVDYIQGAPYGNIVLEASGGAAALEAAIAYVRSLDLQVEILGHVSADALDRPAGPR